MQELENPIWAALNSAQQHFSIPAGAARRYPADVAPFCAVAEEGVPLSSEDLAGWATIFPPAARNYNGAGAWFHGTGPH